VRFGGMLSILVVQILQPLRLATPGDARKAAGAFPWRLLPLSDLSPSITRVEMQKVAARYGPLQRTFLPCQGSCLVSRCLARYLWIRTPLAPRKHRKRPGVHLGILPQLHNILHETEHAPIRVAPHRYPRSSRSGCTKIGLSARSRGLV
jgi:hypothetical protein